VRRIGRWGRHMIDQAKADHARKVRESDARMAAREGSVWLVGYDDGYVHAEPDERIEWDAEYRDGYDEGYSEAN
jgi:hypothetical protein